MAIIDSRGAFHGSAGNLVFRTWRGKRIAQAKPRPFKQTQATKESGVDFGVASSSAKEIRRAFASLCRGKDGGMINRLNRSVLAAIRASPTGVRGQRDLHQADLSVLSGMEFNSHSPLAEVIRFRPQISRNEQGQVVVDLPAFHSERDLKVPAAYQLEQHYALRFQLIGFNYKEYYYEFLGTRDVNLPKNQEVPSRQLVFEEEVPEGCLLLLGMAFLTYRYNGGLDQYECMNDAAFSPAALLGGFQAEEVAGAGTEQQEEQEHINGRRGGMDYEGNSLIEKHINWLLKKGLYPQPEEPPARQEPDIPPAGKRVEMDR